MTSRRRKLTKYFVHVLPQGDGYFVVGVSNEYTLEAPRPDGVLRIRRDVEELAVHPGEADARRRRFEWMEGQPAYTPPHGLDTGGTK